MARIILGSYMVRYPLGGMLSWTLQWPVGLKQLGHEVFILEKATYANACFDPISNTMTNDCTNGWRTVRKLLSRFGLDDNLTFIDHSGVIFGTDERRLRSLFRSADLMVDIGNHGAWLTEAEAASFPTVVVDGEPGFTQFKMEHARAEDVAAHCFDYYYSNGANIGTKKTTAPTGGKEWRHVFNPIVTDLFPVTPASDEAPFTTVMNWQSHSPIEFNGKVYGQKNVEFEKFIDIPLRVDVSMEVAAAGKIPVERLRKSGWRVCNAHAVTETFDSYANYIASSLGEFSVCKNVFVATNSGWFSDRSAAYLASGRPVVLQDTGFGSHLPVGEGLFAVATAEQAVAAINEIKRDYSRHSRCARAIAEEHLDARKVLGAFLRELGI